MMGFLSLYNCRNQFLMINLMVYMVYMVCILDTLFFTFTVEQQSNFPLVVGINHASQHRNPLLCPLIHRHEESYVGRWQSELPVQWNQCCTSCQKDLPPFGTKASRTAEHKVAGTRSRNVAGGSLGVLGSWCHFHPLIPEPMNAGYGRKSTICWMLTQSIDSFLANLAPALRGIAT